MTVLSGESGSVRNIGTLYEAQFYFLVPVAQIWIQFLHHAKIGIRFQRINTAKLQKSISFGL